jgi:hypothetical protein
VIPYGRFQDSEAHVHTIHVKQNKLVESFDEDGART